MEIKKKQDENEEQFIWRLGQAKDNGTLDLSWDEIADIINKEFRGDESEYRTEAAYRKPYQQAAKYYSSGVFTADVGSPEYMQELQNRKHEIRKEKQKLFDERVALNKLLREQGRMESMSDIMRRAIDEYVPVQFEYAPSDKIDDGGNDLIIHLTDLHAGMNITSVFNNYNMDILQDRLKKYLDEIFSIQELYHAKDAFVILGGDMLHGLIHVNARIESKENVVQQIMEVSDFVSNFLYELSLRFAAVHVYTTAGNHSRILPNKEDVAHGENFDLLIPYVCEKALSNIDNVSFYNNYLDYDIAAFTVRGHMVYATHGDKDNPKNVVYHMTQFARKAKLPLPDLCYLGHRHSNGLTTVDGVKVIESGCVDGMDTFAIGQRVTGSPEQTVTVVSEDKLIRALCDIQLD